MKIVILGSTGMAGHIIFSYLKSLKKYEIVDCSFRNKFTSDTIILDVKDAIKVSNFLNEHKPDIIINCVGVLIQGANLNVENAVYINAYFPHFLVKNARQIGAKIIHISTDCVFSGEKGSYLESDPKDAKDIYGQSKALGEIINEYDITIRTSIIGPELKDGEGLFHWFMKQKGTINGYTEAYWSGVTTLELAKAIQYVIEEKTTGLVHLTNGNKISKFDLLGLFNSVYLKGVNILPSIGKRVDKSILNSRKDFNFKVNSYAQMIEEMRAWMNRNIKLYEKNYF